MNDNHVDSAPVFIERGFLTSIDGLIDIVAGCGRGRRTGRGLSG
jgi:hypothetical protein